MPAAKIALEIGIFICSHPLVAPGVGAARELNDGFARTGIAGVDARAVRQIEPVRQGHPFGSIRIPFKQAEVAVLRNSNLEPIHRDHGTVFQFDWLDVGAPSLSGDSIPGSHGQHGRGEQTIWDTSDFQAMKARL